MKMKCFAKFIPVILLLFSLCGCNKLSSEQVDLENTNLQVEEKPIIQKLSKKEKLEDFEFLFDTLSNNYPYFKMNERQYGIDWISNKDKYVQLIQDTEGDLEFFIELDSIIKDLNHGHALIINKSEYSNMLSVYKSVNHVPWLSILEDPAVQRRYGPTIDEKPYVKDTPVESNNLVLDKWPVISTAYIKIKSFDHFNIEGDSERLHQFFNDLNDMHSLIIDIRGNYGGDMTYWTQHLVPELVTEPNEFSQYYCFRGGEYSETFIEFKLGYTYDEMQVIDESFLNKLSVNAPSELKTDFRYYVEDTLVISPKDDSGYSGDIYLLVDGNVYSSAESLVQFIRDTKLATIIGEPTSGERTGFGSLLMRLPNSGYAIQFPSAMLLNSNGINTKEVIIEPDVLVESKMALDKAKEIISSNNK